MEKDLLNVWSHACDLAKHDTRFSLISPWMSRLQPASLERDTLILVLDDASLTPFITADHLRLIGEAASPESPLRVRLGATEKRASIFRSAAALLPASLRDISSPLNPGMTLDHFHVGLCNRLAYATIHAVIDNPGLQYNPVLIHGATGMGKTHLLQAACHGLQAIRPDLSITYLRADAFMAMVDTALQTNHLDVWRENFIQKTDVLVCDDVHMLAGHDVAENELFALFNALYNLKRQLIFSADCAPRRIRGLSERLASRFHWGLIIELEEMAEDMRRIIIRDKMAEQGIEIPEDVQNFLAQQVSTNVRELEGAILKLLGYSSLLDIPITLDIARDVLGDYLQHADHAPTIDDIQKAVCELMDVDEQSLMSASRSHAVAYPRQIAMYLSREMTSTSLEEIGRRFGGRDHSTVKYGCEKVRDLVEKDVRTRNMVRMVREKVLNTR